MTNVLTPYYPKNGIIRIGLPKPTALIELMENEKLQAISGRHREIGNTSSDPYVIVISD